MLHPTRPLTTPRARHAFASPCARSRKPRLLHAGIVALAFVILRLGHRRLCSGPGAQSQLLIRPSPPASVRKAAPCERAEVSKPVRSAHSLIIPLGSGDQ